MSIYISLWNLSFPLEDDDERWIGVYAQAVPPWIGSPPNDPQQDDWLPPPAEDLDGPYRAIAIVDEEHAEKDGQRYTEPLLVLTGTEYEAITFADLVKRIETALEARFGGLE